MYFFRQYHPDVNKNDPECAEKFKNIGPAYDEAIKRLSGPGGSSYNSSTFNSNRRAESKTAGGHSYTSSSYNPNQRYREEFFVQNTFKQSNSTHDSSGSHSRYEDRFADFHKRSFDRRRQHR